MKKVIYIDDTGKVTEEQWRVFENSIINQMKDQLALSSKTLYQIHDIELHERVPEKVFYDMREWSGWRFYAKALRHRDWRSIIYHIRNTFS